MDVDDEGIMEMDLTGLDLNQEPTNQSLHRVERYGSLLNELGTAHDRIEERIRQLEAVTARARQRQRWRQSRNAMEITYSPGEVDVGLRSLVESSTTNTSPVAVGCKRDSSHLVAKALEIDSEVKKSEKEGGGSFYDCNICLELAKDPILTCCGHLFCWPCFFQVSNIDASNKECPVCKGEVSESAVTPIYGNGDSEGMSVTESGLKIPPRPKAGRIESVRQQRVTQGLSDVPVSEALLRIMNSIGNMSTMGSHMLQQTDGRQAEPTDSAGDHRVRIHQVSRVLSESAASLSSLSSALSNAERLVEDLESVINNRVLQGETGALTLDLSQARQMIDVSGLPVGPSPSPSPSPLVWRRSVVSRNLNLNRRDPREPRRRRLN